MNNNLNLFYAKILLFGEYSVIYDSMGLTIPYTHFKGELSFKNEDKYTDYDFAENSNNLLRDFFQYIKNLKETNTLKCDIDINEFEEDLDNRLYFESTIPQGYGLGSSGALCAAVYAKYARNKIKSERTLKNGQIYILKEIFAQLESHFHGTSSGLDPLNSYIKFPLYIKSKSEIEAVGIPRNKKNTDSAIFLINSGKAVKTEPLVLYFLEKCKQKEYLHKVKNALIPLNNNCITSLIQGKIGDFFGYLNQLSVFQINNFNAMIPVSFKEIWQKGLDTGVYYLKLCGSGGGGYILGFTENYEITKSILSEYNIEPITVYKNPKQ